MMKLSTMGLGDRRLDPAGEIPVAALAHERWPHDPGSLHLFRYSSNFIYTFENQGGRCFLRSAHEGQRSRAQIEAEVQLLLWLSGEVIPLATLLPSKHGNFVESIATEFGTFHTVVFEGLAGEQRDIEELDHAGFRAWGAALGQLHAAIRRYPNLQQAARPSWQDDLALVERHLPPHEPAMLREFAHITVALGRLPINPDAFGLVHFDFELDNLIWQDGTPGIIDFDDCSHHWYVADIAFALRDLFDHGVTNADPRVQAFLAGYREYQPIDEITIAQLPLFSRLRRLISYGRIARSLDLDPVGDYQPWLRDLEKRLAAVMSAYPPSLSV